MASAFDPSAFIRAEIAERSQTVAAESHALRGFSFAPETAKIRDKRDLPTPTLATIATIAGVAPKSLPWDDEINDFIDRHCPALINAELWDELTGEVRSVSRRWGQTALDAGWSVLDLFACNRDPFKRRGDRDGLVQSIVSLRTPMQIVELTATHATLQDCRGSTMRYRPALRAPGGSLIWDAYAMPCGP